ncbi:MAG: tellurite resistance TerB family protein [Thiocapsa sp.]|jgi:uncharacterized membrane protein YebE (DUF533 family)|nr:tellurite resistance TerB family protein [Thiocapsa sp.]MCG6896008.1 tellurite resistance TerB family protein [Thiocapsa sp.]MCG6985606.1 tellurite resistance TerB family protein [Thiocapsa sp.]
MAFKDMLDQMLAAGKDLAAQGQAYAQQHMNLPPAGPERDAVLSNLGKGALAGGTLALLLGSRGGRKVAGTAAALGGLGMLGKVAFDAYQTWQADQGAAVAEPGTPVGELSGPAAEQRSRVLFKAMIAAANADGHIDDAERASIQNAVSGFGLDDDIRLMINAELARPLNAADIAADADSPETAAEIYLASLSVIDPNDPSERAYLNELAAALQIEPALARHLEGTAQAA